MSEGMCVGNRRALWQVVTGHIVTSVSKGLSLVLEPFQASQDKAQIGGVVSDILKMMNEESKLPATRTPKGNL